MDEDVIILNINTVNCDELRELHQSIIINKNKAMQVIEFFSTYKYYDFDIDIDDQIVNFICNDFKFRFITDQNAIKYHKIKYGNKTGDDLFYILRRKMISFGKMKIEEYLENKNFYKYGK